MSSAERKCSFCGFLPKQVGPLVSSDGENGKVRICGGCAKLATESLASAQMKLLFPNRKTLESLPTPQQVLDHLDKYVIGQVAAKQKLAIAVANHQRRCLDVEFRLLDMPNPVVDEDLAEVAIEKSNVLLLGPTGCGKTALARSLAKFLDVPFAIADATTLTESGYVGEDVESVLTRLLVAAGFDVDAAQRGIIFIDEIDKIASSGPSAFHRRDPSGIGVQQALLKLLEGTVANVSPLGGIKQPEQHFIQIDTTNILFLCGGAFTGIEEIVARRCGKRSFGFGETATSVGNAHITPEDLRSFGLIPELIGRLPVVTSLSPLTVKDLVRILTEPRDALLRQYQKLAAYYEFTLLFSDGAVKEMAERAMKLGTGARGLRAVVEEVVEPLFLTFGRNNKGKTVVIDEAPARGRKPSIPKFHSRGVVQ